MSEIPPVAPVPDVSAINDNDKLMAALSYFFAPIVGIIVLLVESMKSRPYQRYHGIQSIGLGVAELVFYVLMCLCITVLSFVAIGLCLTPLIFLPLIPNIYYAYLAYAKPSYFEIPVLTKFMAQQGWLKV